MTATDREILLLVLCGLPASGKTHLSRLICDRYGRGSSAERGQTCATSTIDVCYDRLLPAPDFSIAKCRGRASASRWKQYRDSILEAVEALIVEIALRGGDVAASNSNSDEAVPIIRRLVEDTLRNDNNLTLDTLQNELGCRVLFVIDDNMYYKSMRYDYYRLARKYTIGFCQIHVRCDLDTALRRNCSRRSADEQRWPSSVVQVDANVIRNMNEKFEAPDSIIRVWETMSLTLDNIDDDDHLESCLPSLDKFLNVAFKHPVQRLVDENHDNQEEQKAASRLACRRNVLHRVDGLLRKLVSKAAKTDSTRPNVDRLNAARRKLMADIRNGVILLETDLLSGLDSGEEADNVSENLNRFLEDKLNAMTHKNTQ